MKRHGKSHRTGKERVHRLVQKYGKDILASEGFTQSGDYIQHGSKSVLQHSIDVANLSLGISKKLPISFKEREIVRGALLHDYFQYDWHTHKVKLRTPLDVRKMHGFTHPTTALQNADRDFSLSDREKDIIKKHMWPLTIKPPKCREAWVVTMADKYCSLRETIHRRRS